MDREEQLDKVIAWASKKKIVGNQALKERVAWELGFDDSDSLFRVMKWNDINRYLKDKPIEYGDAFVPVTEFGETNWIYNPKPHELATWSFIELKCNLTRSDRLFDTWSLPQYVTHIPAEILTEIKRMNKKTQQIIDAVEESFDLDGIKIG